MSQNNRKNIQNSFTTTRSIMPVSSGQAAEPFCKPIHKLWCFCLQQAKVRKLVRAEGGTAGCPLP